METLNQDFFNMYTRNIHQYDSYEELEKKMKSNQNFKKISENTLIKIKEYYNKYGRKPKYWMLICNPTQWGNGTEQFEVNELLKSLDIEAWKINDRTSMNLQMKKGDLGIIKVSNDTRTEINRLDDNGDLVPLLDAGIYATFEVINDEDNAPTWEGEDGNFYVNIQVTNNLFKKKKNINKDTSIELLGKNLYSSIPSTKIEQKVYENVLNHINNIK